VVVAPDAHPLERYAAEEMRAYLSRLTTQPVALGDGEGTRIAIGTLGATRAFEGFEPALPAALREQETLVRSGTLGGSPCVAVTGGSAEATLWAAYALLEHLGVIFEFSGEIVPAPRESLDLTGLDLRAEPSIRERGLRLHLNFPMDQSAYSLDEFRAWVDRVARLKLNYLEFHFYSAHPWFRFEYRGVKTVHGTFFVGSPEGVYRLPPDMIGRDKVRNREVFFPPEMEGLSQGEELYARTEARMGAVMDHAHARGIRVCVSFEPLGPPGDIAAHLGEWEQQAGGRDALMRDLTVERLLACMRAYPQADEYQLISVEGSSDAPAGLSLPDELKRLCAKYGVPFDPADEARFAGAKVAGVHLTPYNDPATARQLEGGLYFPVVSTLRFVDLARDVLADPRVAGPLRAGGKKTSIGIYLPHAEAVRLCLPALRGMIPENGRLQLMVDYGARGTADQMAAWGELRGAPMQLGVISWLEFDGSMFMPEAWPRSVFDCVRNANGLPLTSLVANHWRVAGLEADAACLAEAPWQAGASYDEWFGRYLGRVFGEANAPQARAAYDALEEATLYCRAHLFNVGFCWEGRWLSQGFGYPAEQMEEAKALFAKARDGFAVLSGALPEGRARLRAQYLASRCECGRLHLATVQALGAAERDASLAPAARDSAEAYMREYARFVLDRGDEGMLVNYNFGPLERARRMVEQARLAAIFTQADPERPVVRWSFERDREGVVADDDGRGVDARAVGTVGFAAGHAGRALQLTGEGYLRADAGGGFAASSFTISAWIRPDTTTNRRGIVAKRVGNTETPFVLGLSNGRLTFDGCGTGPVGWTLNLAGPEIASGEWSHVAVTVEAGKQVTLYLNGVAAATLPIAEAPKPNTEPIVIGREAWGGEGGTDSPGLFVGLIDEVKLWARALTPDEIQREAQE
jgi:hypothetical protein